MVCYDEVEYGNKRSLFDREYKRVEAYNRRTLTKDLNLRKEYKQDLVRTYNDIVTFFQPILRTAPLEEKLDIQTLVVEHLKKLKEAFCLLKLEYTFSKVIYDTIDFDKITQDWSDIEDDNNDSSTTQDDSLNGSTINTSGTEQSEKSKQSTTDTDTTIQKTNSNQNKNTKMVQSQEEFMALAHRAINYKFGGDPLALDSFLDAINLLTTLCKPENKDLCIQFIMTKLEGEAREAIVTAPLTTKDIIDQLQSHIKTESSKVVEGRILALRADKTNLTNFSQRAEELAEQYRRSLCKEGYSKEKAKELAIEKTVDLCRRSARSEQVRSIIASKAFTEPKEVIAKMIVEINNLKLDKGATQYNHKYNNNQNKNGNNRTYKNNGNFNKHNNRNSGSSNSQNNNNNGRNWHNNNNRNGNNGNSNSNRSNYNGQNSRTFHNSNNNNNNNNNGRRNDQQVRFYSGNEVNPGNGGQSPEQAQ